MSKLKKCTSKPTSNHVTPILEGIFNTPSRNTADLTPEQASLQYLLFSQEYTGFPT